MKSQSKINMTCNGTKVPPLLHVDNKGPGRVYTGKFVQNSRTFKDKLQGSYSQVCVKFKDFPRTSCMVHTDKFVQLFND